MDGFTRMTFVFCFGLHICNDDESGFYEYVMQHTSNNPFLKQAPVVSGKKPEKTGSL
jgi:hypothetical protein